MPNHNTDPDFQQMFVVAMELLMSLYAIAYAYPFVPDRITEDPTQVVKDDNTTIIVSSWFVVETTDQLHQAIANLLSSSTVLMWALQRKYNIVDINGYNMSSMQRISELFNLDLYNKQVPGVCRQMFQLIASTYNTVMQLTGTVTRQDLLNVYEYFGISRGTRVQDRTNATASDMIRQSSRLAFQWLQPYFSWCPVKFWPPLLEACAVAP